MSSTTPGSDPDRPHDAGGVDGEPESETVDSAPESAAASDAPEPGDAAEASAPEPEATAAPIDEPEPVAEPGSPEPEPETPAYEPEPVRRRTSPSRAATSPSPSSAAEPVAEPEPVTQPDATARLDAAVERANAPVAADPNDVGDADVPVPIAADSVRRETYVPAATVAAGTAAGAATLAPEPDAVPAAFAAPQTIYVQAPTPPKTRGNRGFGVLVALIGTIAFAALYAGVSYLLLLGQGDAVQASSVFTQFVARPVFWVPIIATFVGFALLAVIVNRGPWWYYAVFGLLVGVLVYFSYIGAALLTVEAWTLTRRAGERIPPPALARPVRDHRCGRGARDPDLVRRMDRGTWPHGRRAQPARTRGLRPRTRGRPAAAARLSERCRGGRGAEARRPATLLCRGW